MEGSEEPLKSAGHMPLLLRATVSPGTAITTARVKLDSTPRPVAEKVVWRSIDAICPGCTRTGSGGNGIGDGWFVSGVSDERLTYLGASNLEGFRAYHERARRNACATQCAGDERKCSALLGNNGVAHEGERGRAMERPWGAA